PRYVDQTQDPEPYLTIHRTPQVSSLPDSRVGRLVKAVVHAAAAVPLSLTTEVDVVVATVPALPNLLAGRVIAWLKGLPYVVAMRDAWPDLIAKSESGSKLFGTLVPEAITKLQHSADQRITVTHGFAQTLQQRNMPPVEVISNSRAIEQLPVLDARTRQPGELHVLDRKSVV